MDSLPEDVASGLDLSPDRVRETLNLLDDGNTVPFIARYRKEQTGELDEVQIREVRDVAEQLRKLEKRRESILETIEQQGELDDGLRSKINQADSLSRLEDLYAPYRPKRMTRGKKAMEAGLDPVTEAIWADEPPEPVAKDKICDAYPTVEDVIDGAKDIIAERIADDAEIRNYVRRKMREHGKLVSKPRRGGERDSNFEMYYEFSAPVDRVKPHQTLAIRRGEDEKVLSAGVEVNEEPILKWIESQLDDVQSRKSRRLVREAVEDAFKRRLHPIGERDILSDLEEGADEHAIEVFSVNLKSLLMQSPLPDRRLLGIDPGFRTGCKLVVVDESGALQKTDKLFVNQDNDDASEIIEHLVDEYGVDVIAIGNGTASRETEELVAETIREAGLDVKYTIVDEAGASVYSASETAREEFPDLDVSYRGAVSIARRIQDPLAELVKIDPKSIGVGMYQHDVNQNRLQESLDAVVEDVVNRVGVDLNSASKSLLECVAGLGPTLADRIVDFRDRNGVFESREQLKEVSGVGPKTFQQCAGFLRIRDGAESLDSTGIHPDDYDVARRILEIADTSLEAPDGDALGELKRVEKLQQLTSKVDAGRPTVEYIIDELAEPGRDPRDDVEPPELRSDVLSMDDLEEGMRLNGTVRNVVDFGAFVDVGVKEDGLVHISEMADRFVDNPQDILSAGEQIEVVVQSVDKERGRIGLSIKEA